MTSISDDLRIAVTDFFHDKTIVVTGGTGSLGRVLCRRLLSSSVANLIVFSRDEAKHHEIRYETSWGNDPRLHIVLGDVRNLDSLLHVVDGSDIVVNAAALKQVPACEYAPWEAIQTNIAGAENLMSAVRRSHRPPSVIVGVSTDKACKPVNVMGMTKALQERIFLHGNLRVDTSKTKIICVRYGNVLASRGSVIPLFQQQIHDGGPVTMTSGIMTRFLLSLDHAVDTIVRAVEFAAPGETWIPRVRSAYVSDIAKAMIGDRDIPIIEIGVRPGEKIHEILISEEEGPRSRQVQDGWYAIQSGLPELHEEVEPNRGEVVGEYSSRDVVMSFEATRSMLGEHGFLSEARVGQEARAAD